MADSFPFLKQQRCVAPPSDDVSRLIQSCREHEVTDSRSGQRSLKEEERA